jgi:hypothetical protein
LTVITLLATNGVDTIYTKYWSLTDTVSGAVITNPFMIPTIKADQQSFDLTYTTSHQIDKVIVRHYPYLILKVAGRWNRATYETCEDAVPGVDTTSLTGWSQILMVRGLDLTYSTPDNNAPYNSMRRRLYIYSSIQTVFVLQLMYC